MGKLVAIGGGHIATGETLSIDKEIISLTGVDRPRALFVPTASSDSKEYWQVFQAVYGKRLGCYTDVLYLLGVNPTRKELEEKILSTDLVYVGGGNTLKMMRRWRRLGVDRVLEEAWRRGTVLCGLSAGCICWFSWGHSDSMAFYHPESWQYVRVKGMGLIDGFGCPHYDSDTAGVKRAAEFQGMVREYSDVGIAIDDRCALEVVDDTYRVITSRADAGVHRLTKRRGGLSIRQIEQKAAYEPIAELLGRE